MNMCSTFTRSALCFAILLVGVIGCSKNSTGPNDGTSISATTPDNGKTKVGFITVGPVSDWGYNYAHNQGRLFMEAKLSGKVQTTIVENVPESSEVERVMEKMIADGTKIIFPTSYGYLDPALRVAKRHPNVVFMHCGGFKNSDNLGTYFAYIHEPMYVAGMVAGSTTKTNKLGFVAAHPIPQVLRNINAFTLGARASNPDVKVNVVWTNSWYDPATEAEAAKGLIESGADVLTMHQDSPLTVVQTAEANGVFSVGYHADLNQFAPNGWLTGAEWDWGKLYTEITESASAGSWKTEQLRSGMDGGSVRLARFGTAVAPQTQVAAKEIVKKIVAGEYVVFQGPLKDRDGKERIAAGEKPDFNWMEKMDWFVEGVEGSIPKK